MHIPEIPLNSIEVLDPLEKVEVALSHSLLLALHRVPEISVQLSHLATLGAHGSPWNQVDTGRQDPLKQIETYGK